MIFTMESLSPQLKELLCVYPGLEVVLKKEDKVVVSGEIGLYVKDKQSGFSVRGKYRIDIVIPLCSDELPFVKDVGKQIYKKYHHIYNTGKLCLETDTAIRLRFVDGFDLVAWMKEFVEPYFLSYEYYMRYHTFPFGERCHGVAGILQTYQEVFNTSNQTETLRVMEYIYSHSYRGHASCPCGSGLRLRNCHGEKMLSIFDDKRKKDILINDYNLIRRDKNAGDNKTTK